MLSGIHLARQSDKTKNYIVLRECNVMYSCNLYSFKIYYVLRHAPLLPSESVEQNLLKCSSAVIKSVEDQKLAFFIFRY